MTNYSAFGATKPVPYPPAPPPNSARPLGVTMSVVVFFSTTTVHCEIALMNTRTIAGASYHDTCVARIQPCNARVPPLKRLNFQRNYFPTPATPASLGTPAASTRTPRSPPHAIPKACPPRRICTVRCALNISMPRRAYASLHLPGPHTSTSSTILTTATPQLLSLGANNTRLSLSFPQHLANEGMDMARKLYAPLCRYGLPVPRHASQYHDQSI